MPGTRETESDHLVVETLYAIRSVKGRTLILTVGWNVEGLEVPPYRTKPRPDVPGQARRSDVTRAPGNWPATSFSPGVRQRGMVRLSKSDSVRAPRNPETFHPPDRVATGLRSRPGQPRRNS